MSTATSRKWISTAGPRQTKQVQEALNRISGHGRTRKEITDYGEHCLMEIFGAVRPEVVAKQVEIAERFDYQINRENFKDVIAAVDQAINECPIPVVDKRTTPEQREQLRIEREQMEAEQAERSRVHAEEKAKCLAELRAAYPWVDPNDKRDDLIRAASNIRVELAKAFPGIKFSVKSDRFSMGDSIDVSWSMGPTTKEVDRIIGKYQGGSFDGMTDMYNNDHSAYGEACKSLLGEAKYVHSHREIPKDVHEIVGRSLCELQHVEYAGNNTRSVFGECDQRSLSDYVYLYLGKASLPPGAKVTGVEHVEYVEGMIDFEPYRIAFDAPAVAPTAETVEASGCEIQKHHHTKRGVDFWLVVLADRVDEATFERLRASCKAAGGWYSRKWGSTPGGFGFSSEEAAQAWASNR